MTTKQTPVKAASLRPQNWQQVQAFVEKLLAGRIPMDKVNLGSVNFFTCTGSPNGQVKANVGSLCHRTDGGAGTTLYVKESGNGTNTGWVGK